MATAFDQGDGAPPGLAEAAIGYAANGWPVFPLKPRHKEPITAHGLLDATTDPKITAERWQGCPHANIGIRTGKDGAGYFVIDVDGQRGKDSLAELEAWHGKLPPTKTSRTGGGGLHFLFRYPDFRVRNNNTGKIGKGIDVRGERGYIVVEPSIHPNGTPYEWVDRGAEIAEAPQWLLGLLKGRGPQLLPTANASGSRVTRGERHGRLV